MRERISLEEAWTLITAPLRPLGEEQVDLDHALDQTLSRDVWSSIDQPPFDRSPLDGYALQSRDVQGACPEHPASLQVVERVCAGEVPRQRVTPGTAVRIMTGAPLPQGCDCVVRQEDTDLGEKVVQVYASVGAHQNFIGRGEDYTAGTCLLSAGTWLDAAALGLLASAGCDRVWVHRRPRVALLVTGDEVVQPQVHPLPPGKIYTANTYLLSARLRQLGVEAVTCATVGDDPQETAQQMRGLLEHCDCLITTGGVSVGERDVLHQALPMAGAQQVFWRVQMKPGTPAMYALLDGKPILSLSGNPFAAVATFELLGRPMLHTLCPAPQFELETRRAVLDTSFDRPSGMRRFLRGTYQDGRLRLPQDHSSGSLRSLVGCNCLLEAPAGSQNLEAGEKYTVYL